MDEGAVGKPEPQASVRVMEVEPTFGIPDILNLMISIKERKL